MPQSLTCPACKAKLQIADEPSERTLTCPRCLADVEAPNAVEGSRSGTATQDAVRDTRRTSAGIAILAALGGLGLGWWLLGVLAITAQPQSRVGPGPLVAWLVVVGFLTLVATGIVWARTRNDPSAMDVGRIVIGTLALAGGFVLVGVALLIFLFVVCLAALSGPHV